MTQTRHPIQIVVAYDFSPSSEEALRQAVDFVTRETQHVLQIAAVLDPHDRMIIAGESEPPTYETADKIQKMILERVTAAFAGRPTEAPIDFFVHARIGKAAVEVLALAAEIGADHIFIGSHGKTGVERLVLGSVSERVAREAKCPVTVARAKTYADVDLMKVTRYEHARTLHREPHVYSYTNRKVTVLADEWPTGS